MDTISSGVYPMKPNNRRQTCLSVLFGVSYVCRHTHAWPSRHMCMCVRVCVCVCVNLACLLYNKHWSKTGPSCQAAAVTTNNDYPLPAPQSLLHNHQRRGDPPLLGEQCNPWVGLIIAQAHSYQPSEGPPDPISLCVCLCVFVCVLISVNLLRFLSDFFQWAPPAQHSLPGPWMIQALLVLADYVSINTYGPHIFIKQKKKRRAVRSSDGARSQLSWLKLWAG